MWRRWKPLGKRLQSKCTFIYLYILQTDKLSDRDPSVKRTLCRGCNIILIPGLTASVRVKCGFLSLPQSYAIIQWSQPLASPSHGHAVTYTCNACNTSRRIPAPPTLAPPSTSSLPSPSNPLISASSAPISTANIIPPTTGSTPKETLDTRAQAQHQHQQRKKKKKPPVPRLPPLFAREGHVVFSGNERLEAEQPAMDWDG